MKKYFFICALFASIGGFSQSTLQLSKDGKVMEEITPAKTVTYTKEDRIIKLNQLKADSVNLAKQKINLLARIEEINAKLKIVRDICKKIDK